MNKYSAKQKNALVLEYLSGKSSYAISRECNVAPSTILAWVKKYNEECQYTTTDICMKSPTNIRELNKRILELEKENQFLKKAAAFFKKEID